MIREFFLGIRDLASRGRRGREKLPPARRLVLLIIVATLPLFVVLPIKDLVEGAMSNVTFVSFALLATGFILFFSDRMARGRKTERTATVLDALLVGCAQALGTLPGISRSGITISAGMLRGYDRTFAVRFSFLMSLPAVFGATLLELIDAVQAGIDTSLLPVYLVGMLVAGVVGYFAIRLVNLLAGKGKFGAFAYYCWAAGAISLAVPPAAAGGTAAGAKRRPAGPCVGRSGRRCVWRWPCSRRWAISTSRPFSSISSPDC